MGKERFHNSDNSKLNHVENKHDDEIDDGEDISSQDFDHISDNNPNFSDHSESHENPRGDKDPRINFERYLRYRFPNWSDKRIIEEIEAVFEDELLVELIKLLEKLDSEVMSKYPKGGWLRWYERFNPDIDDF
jgi:hypothetical protein